jgi:membrane protease YdiL (CAAX protease family)
MADNRDVTWDVPPARMHPTAIDAPSPPEVAPFGAWRALKIFLAFLGVQLITAVGAGLFLAARHLKGGGSADGVAVDPRLALAAGLFGTVAAGLVALFMVRRAFSRPGGADLRAAVGWAPASARACARAAFVGVALVAAFVSLSALLPARPENLGLLARAANMGGWARVCWAVLAIAVAPPTEELLFRGVLYAGLVRSWGGSVAAAATTAIFVALHATELGAYWPGWIGIAILGAVALRARLVSGSLLPAMALHASYNLGLVLLVYATRA